MSDFDPFDDELADALQRRSGAPTTSTAAAHDAVLRRAGTIRRRRAAIGGGSAMAVLLIGGIALFPGEPDEIGPAVTGDVLPTFEATTTTGPDDELPEAVTAPTTVDLSIPTVVATTVPEDRAPTTVDLVGEPDSETPSTSAPSTSAPSTSAPSTSALATSSAPDLALAPFTDTYQSAGGSITVSWNGSALTLQSILPASGFVAELEQSSATRVRVRFEGADDDSRIEVRVDGGTLAVDVE